MPETTKPLGREIFDYLRSDQMDKISMASDSIKRQAGEKIYERGQKTYYLFIVLKGKVALSYPIKQNMSVIIEEVLPGSLFGFSSYLKADAYYLTAQCLEDSEILRIDAAVLRKLMDEDLKMGYAIQTQLTDIYFRRYINAMKKLKAVVLDIDHSPT